MPPVTHPIFEWADYPLVETHNGGIVIPGHADGLTCFAEITDIQLAQIPRAGIKTLILSGCEQLTEKGFALLREFEELENLDCTACEQMTPLHFSAMCDTKSLRKVDLSFCDQITRETGYLLDDIVELTRLEVLSLNFMYSVTDPVIDMVAKLPQLRGLSLKSCESLSDKSIQSLSACPSLQFLELPEFGEFTDSGLEVMSRNFANLKFLRLTCLRGITDAGVAMLPALPRLESLIVESCHNITETGIRALHSARQLRKLWLTGISCGDQTIQYLKEQAPGLQIYTS